MGSCLLYQGIASFRGFTDGLFSLYWNLLLREKTQRRKKEVLQLVSILRLEEHGAGKLEETGTCNHQIKKFYQLLGKSLQPPIMHTVTRFFSRLNKSFKQNKTFLQNVDFWENGQTGCLVNKAVLLYNRNVKLYVNWKMINRDYSWKKQGGVVKRKMDLISVNIIRVSACNSGIIIWTYTISVNPGEFVAWDRKVYNQVILGPGISANKQISEKVARTPLLFFY